jgi:hypothetical protein
MEFIYLQQAAKAIAENETDPEAKNRHWLVPGLADDLHQAFRTAVFNGELTAYNTRTGLTYKPGQHENTIFTTPAAINKWLESQGASYRYGSENSDKKPVTNINNDLTLYEDGVKTKIEKQQAAILQTIKTKRFDPMAIPDGGKGTIKIICETDYPLLFGGDTSFDRAWKAGIKTLWKMENYESYAKRGNN